MKLHPQVHLLLQYISSFLGKSFKNLLTIPNVEIITVWQLHLCMVNLAGGFLERKSWRKLQSGISLHPTHMEPKTGINSMQSWELSLFLGSYFPGSTILPCFKGWMQHETNQGRQANPLENIQAEWDASIALNPRFRCILAWEESYGIISFLAALGTPWI